MKRTAFREWIERPEWARGFRPRCNKHNLHLSDDREFMPSDSLATLAEYGVTEHCMCLRCGWIIARHWQPETDADVSVLYRKVQDTWLS